MCYQNLIISKETRIIGFMRCSVRSPQGSHSKAWKDNRLLNRPYPNWADYAPRFSGYWKNRQSNYREKSKLPEGQSLNSWLSSHETGLRKDRYQRPQNAIVALELLPLFEAAPAGWNAIRKLPNSKGFLVEYFSDWHSVVDSEDKPFVARLAEAFDYTIAP